HRAGRRLDRVGSVTRLAERPGGPSAVFADCGGWNCGARVSSLLRPTVSLAYSGAVLRTRMAVLKAWSRTGAGFRTGILVALAPRRTHGPGLRNRFGSRFRSCGHHDAAVDVRPTGRRAPAVLAWWRLGRCYCLRPAHWQALSALLRKKRVTFS